MGFQVLAVREPGDGDDGVLYPLVAEDARGIIFEENDGDFDTVIAKGAEIYHFGAHKQHRIAGVDNVKIDLHITDLRVALACPKYDKGGGWVGGLTAMVVLNAASKIRAALGSRGTCLVGHVRYAWLASVGFRSKIGIIGSLEEIRLLMSDNTEGKEVLMSLDLSLPKGLSSMTVADEILRRAANFRLAHHPALESEQRDKLELLEEHGLPDQHNDGTKFTMTALPGTMQVLRTTATYST